jgi:hypothetical protein
VPKRQPRLICNWCWNAAPSTLLRPCLVLVLQTYVKYNTWRRSALNIRLLENYHSLRPRSEIRSGNHPGCWPGVTHWQLAVSENSSSWFFHVTCMSPFLSPQPGTVWCRDPDPEQSIDGGHFSPWTDATAVQGIRGCIERLPRENTSTRIFMLEFSVIKVPAMCPMMQLNTSALTVFEKCRRGQG